MLNTWQLWNPTDQLLLTSFDSHAKLLSSSCLSCLLNPVLPRQFINWVNKQGVFSFRSILQHNTDCGIMLFCEHAATEAETASVVDTFINIVPFPITQPWTMIHKLLRTWKYRVVSSCTTLYQLIWVWPTRKRPVFCTWSKTSLRPEKVIFFESKKEELDMLEK